MIDIFGEVKIDLKKVTCHSGGAIGSDIFWEECGEEYGVKTKAYSHKTTNHKGSNKIEISDDDYRDGVIEVNKANKFLKRYGISKYMNLLARNWAQVKYSKQIFAIGYIINPNQKDTKGYVNKSDFDIVSGGTGYAVQMGINNERVVYVFDQLKDNWFRWSYTSLSFIKLDKTPIITEYNFAGIGTREIKENGINAINDVYLKTLNNSK